MRTALRLSALALVLGSGCADPVSSLAVIILTNTWQEEGTPTHTISFLDDTDGEAQSSGAFTGTETMPNGVEWEVTGSWANSRVTLITERAPNITWRATITEDNTDRLAFSSSSGTLVLVRNVN